MKRTLLLHYNNVMGVKTNLNLGEEFFYNSLRFFLQERRRVCQILLVLVLGICYSTVSATTYYVSSSLGNDSNSGTSESLAWKSLTKVNASTFKAGDQILFKRGDVWRETLTIPSSGTSDKYITFGGYDIGDNPKILGSVQATTWSATGMSNVWVSNTIVLNNPYNMYTKAEIFFQELDNSVKWGNYKTYSDLSELTTEYDWTWTGNQVYVYATSDPDSRYTSVEVPQRRNGIELNDKEYITIDGIDMFYQIQAGVRESYPARDLNGLIIKNCEIAYNGVIESTFAVGMSVWHSDMLIQNNTIHDCGRRGVSINLDTGSSISIQNIIIQNNHFYNGFHTTGTDISNIGESSMNDITVRYNFFEGSQNRKVGAAYDAATNTYPRSNHIYSANNSTGSINNLNIYYNKFTYCYGGGVVLNGLDISYVYNNTFYGFNTTLDIGTGQIYYQGVHKSAVARNNLFYNDADHNTYQFLLCIYSTSEASPNVDIDYNLYYCVDPDISAFTNGGSFYKISQWPTYKSTTGWDVGSPAPANPMFISTTDYRFQSSSTAINAGVNVGLTTDYQGNPIVGTPDLGTFEYGDNADLTPPVVSAFTIPATSTSLSVPISAFMATDNIGVTGYLLTETSTTPTAGASGWSSAKPTTYTFLSNGTKTLYAWAKDTAGNISASLSANVIISSVVNTVYSTEDISICEGSSYGFDEELVTNGDFSTSGSWTLGNSAVIGSGILSLKGASMYVYQNVSVENGSTYRLTYEITEAKSIDGLYLSYNGFVASSTKIPYTLGVHSVDIVCKDDTKPLQIITSTTATNDVGIDNISLKKVWTTTGQYQRTLTAVSGADSIVTTNLTVNPVYNITEDITILEGESYLGWTESGQYKRTLTSVSGCDSIITTNLIVALNKNTTEDITICESSSYEGWTTTGQYERVLTAVSGADSIVTTNLTVNPVYNITEDITILEGESYLGWTEAGQYERTLTSVSGCDSIITTNLIVALNKNTIEDITICEGSSYDGWTTTGQYERVLTAVSGADSIVTTNLIVNPVYHISEDITIYEGESYQGWDQSGQYERTLTSVTGCDSIVNTNLTVELVTQMLTQSIELEKGWNIFSSYVVPVDTSMDAIQSMLSSDKLLFEVEDELGNTYEKSANDWINNIGEIHKTEGYKIRVKASSTLKITGSPVNLPLNIELYNGWNLISFPYAGTVDAMEVIQPLIDDGVLVKVQDEKGNSIEYWGASVGWINGIGDFNAGEGYLIQVNTNCGLPILSEYQKSAAKQLTNDSKTEYFGVKFEGNGNGHMNINIVGLNEFDIQLGDEIAAFDGITCVGAVRITSSNIDNNVVSLSASVSDKDVLNGFSEGDPITLLIWHTNTDEVVQFAPEIIEGSLLFEAQSSVFVGNVQQSTTVINEFESVKVDMFPNPANTNVTIRLSLLPERKTKIELVNMTGKTILHREVQATEEVFDVQSQSEGIYLVKILSGDNLVVKKLIIN